VLIVNHKTVEVVSPSRSLTSVDELTIAPGIELNTTCILIEAAKVKLM
jgi:hypothetical protein